MRGALRNPDEPAAKNKRKPQPRLFDLEKSKQLVAKLPMMAFPMNSVIVDGVKPSLAELERFQETADDLKKELESTMMKEKGHNFSPGDNVEVTDGELVNLKGKVSSIDGDRVIILPDHKDLTEPLTLHAHELRKFFKAGDHVRVVDGRYQGDTGLTLRVEDNMVILLSDLTMDELKVLPKDVQLCADIATGVDSIGQYQYQDMVMLDKETVGVIVRLEREHVEVLTMNGKTVRSSRRPYSARKSQTPTLDADLLRSPHPLSSPRPNGAFTPAQSNSSRSVVGAQSVHGGSGSNGFNGGAGGGGGSGLYGIVKDATDSTVRVELHTMPKIINMDKSKVVEVGGGVIAGSMTVPFARTPNTPMYGSGAQTPMHDYGGGRTPHYGGGQTPAYDAGGRTPIQSSSWDPTVANTPAHSSSIWMMTLKARGQAPYATPSAMTPNTTGSGAGTMYSDYAAASPYPRSNYDSASASPFHSAQGSTTMTESYLKTGEWCCVDLCVNVRRTYSEEDVHNIEGVIRSCQEGRCEVYFDDIDEDKTVSFDYLLQ
uniref:Transcription elongation factor SPT5 n=1 Tax=Ditylenchus dipsaci TaxID=166011 RepID=A0A915EW08_9BILA